MSKTVNNNKLNSVSAPLVPGNTSNAICHYHVQQMNNLVVFTIFNNAFAVHSAQQHQTATLLKFGTELWQRLMQTRLDLALNPTHNIAKRYILYLKIKSFWLCYHELWHRIGLKSLNCTMPAHLFQSSQLVFRPNSPQLIRHACLPVIR